MYVGKVTIPYRRAGDSITIVPLSDLHYGNSQSDVEAFKKELTILERENTYFFLIGDMVDSIIITDPRYDFQNAMPGDILMDHADYVVELVEPYADKCIGVLTGNHEEKLRKKCQIDISRYIAKQLDAPYMGYTALLLFSFTRGSHSENYSVFVTHGGFNVSTRQGRVKKLEDLSLIADADLYLCAHTHDILYTRSVTFAVNRAGKLVTKEKVFVLTGGYLRGYTDHEYGTYVETRTLKPLIIGTPKVVITPEQRRVDVYDTIG